MEKDSSKNGGNHTSSPVTAMTAVSGFFSCEETEKQKFVCALSSSNETSDLEVWQVYGSSISPPQAYSARVDLINPTKMLTT